MDTKTFTFGVSGATVLARAVPLSFALALHCQSAQAGPVRIVITQENAGAAKNGVAIIKSGVGGPNAKVVTDFFFHPNPLPVGDPSVTVFAKPIPAVGGKLAAPPVVHANAEPPGQHGTTGSATHTVTISQPVLTTFIGSDRVAGVIDPGLHPQKANVQIKSDYLDPFSFSSTNPNASYLYLPGGLDFSLSLLAGTAFPDVFSPDPDSFGAVAPETSMVFRARVAPGVFLDGGDFWSDMVPDAIDLYTLTLTSDVNHVISAALSFAANTTDFALDFKNNLGMAFNPTDPAEVALLEAAIGAAFSGGQLNSDLANVLTVGFVPSGSVSEFTLGGRTGITLTAVETGEPVPEPSTAVLVSCVVVFPLIRYRKRMSQLVLCATESWSVQSL